MVCLGEVFKSAFFDDAGVSSEIYAIHSGVSLAIVESEAAEWLGDFEGVCKVESAQPFF